MLVDLSGFDCKNGDAAIEKARVLAIGVPLDKQAVEPKRRSPEMTVRRFR
jgi:hypothetical protein